jgi:hypothetical protein
MGVNHDISGSDVMSKGPVNRVSSMVEHAVNCGHNVYSDVASCETS